MRRFLTWLAIAFFLAWGGINIIGNLDEAQSVIAKQSATVKMLVALASSAPWWLPTGILVACLITAICLEFDCLPRQRAELSPFSTKIVRAGDKYQLQIGVKNTRAVKAIDTQITTMFWRCSGERKPFMVRKSNANPISQDVPERIKLDFTIEPIDPVFIVMSFAYRSSERGKLKEQHPSFYYRWNGSDSSLVHASKEERDVIANRLARGDLQPATNMGNESSTNVEIEKEEERLDRLFFDPRVTYEETDQMIEIFKDAPKVGIAITSLSSRAGEEFRTVTERAGWLHQAFNRAGVNATLSLWETLGSVPDGVKIWWVKNAINNDMVARVISAAEIKGLHPLEVQRPVSAGDCQIELMIGRDPTQLLW
jgi:hypothetical protein